MKRDNFKDVQHFLLQCDYSSSKCKIGYEKNKQMPRGRFFECHVVYKWEVSGMLHPTCRLVVSFGEVGYFQ